MPHIPFGNYLNFCKLSGQRDSQTLRIWHSTRRLEFRLKFLARSPDKALRGKCPRPSPSFPSYPRTEGTLNHSSSQTRRTLLLEQNPPLWELLCSCTSQAIRSNAVRILLCWRQNTSQNPADFARISFRKKTRKTKSSSSVETFLFNMFPAQHGFFFCFFF